jgi:flavin reductase (DIM6/NTAB) family NADH-FMN oxidoreductase RutF
MARRTRLRRLPLGRAYRLIEPGPVVLVVGCGNASGRTTDKFTRFGLTALPASLVSAPLVAECWANLECRLVDEALADSYNFVVLEVVAAWIDPARKAPRTLHHRGRGEFAVDGRVLRLPSRMK